MAELPSTVCASLQHLHARSQNSLSWSQWLTMSAALSLLSAATLQVVEYPGPPCSQRRSLVREPAAAPRATRHLVAGACEWCRNPLAGFPLEAMKELAVRMQARLAASQVAAEDHLSGRSRPRPDPSRSLPQPLAHKLADAMELACSELPSLQAAPSWPLSHAPTAALYVIVGGSTCAPPGGMTFTAVKACSQICTFALTLYFSGLDS
mmetsp:Transcript_100258/g.313296  ORF Transcript_100258/g.313296 Transcript_100258/m.313296 type:complete len:208 (-) Transcript_100258:92-715(-)